MRPVQELRVKGSYLHHKEITAAQGVKIAAPGLENAVAGTQLLVVGKDDDISLLKEEVMQDMESIFDSVDRSGTSLCSARPGYHGGQPHASYPVSTTALPCARLPDDCVMHALQSPWPHW